MQFDTQIYATVYHAYAKVRYDVQSRRVSTLLYAMPTQ